MENKFELVEKYNIDVDVFIEENGVTPKSTIQDIQMGKVNISRFIIEQKNQLRHLIR